LGCGTDHQAGIMTDRKANALAAREAIEAAHPEITIVTPLTSRSGLWELSIDDDSTTEYSDFWMMIDHLAELFGDIGPQS
jgi:hypothetical protein